MTEAGVSLAGNLTDDPELLHTEGGIAGFSSRSGVSARAWLSPGSCASRYVVAVAGTAGFVGCAKRVMSTKIPAIGTRSQNRWPQP